MAHLFPTLLPLQHPLIQLVGLRGNAFLLPFLLIGGRLDPREARRLALWLGVLNVMAIGFAGAEYFRGVPAYYPRNAVTDIIYKSNDVAGYTALRIPACFVNAHAFAGTMVSTLPWLLGAWLQRGNRLWQHALLGTAVAAAVLGVFMSATRINMILLVMLLGLLVVSGKLRGGPLLGLVILLGGVGFLVSGEARLQRFMSLGDTGQVATRVEGSVNVSFVELLVQYPLGNGMGAGGTSIPYFLEHLLHKPVGMENEYSRILLEQGWPGLALWAAFIVWVAQAAPERPPRPLEPRAPAALVHRPGQLRPGLPGHRTADGHPAVGGVPARPRFPHRPPAGAGPHPDETGTEGREHPGGNAAS